MHLLYADETNTDADASDFFVYAGVVIPPTDAGRLATKLDEVRAKHGYQPTDALKSTVSERPEHVDGTAHAAAKQGVLEAAKEHGVKLFTTSRTTRL